MRRILNIVGLFAALLAPLASAPVAAQTMVTVTVTEEVYFVDADGNRVDDPAAGPADYLSDDTAGTSERLVEVAPARVPAGIARYGPFRVIDATHAAVVDVTDGATPGAFNAMLRDYPGIAALELVDCPGTEDDRANLRLGRMVRAHGITTHIPSGGSVRSGGVELFLAGARHTADAGAEFAVHAWADEDGLEPDDYAADAPENRAYLDYYREMGMSAIEARAFYAMTNAVPNADARFMSKAQMGQWVRLD